MSLMITEADRAFMSDDEVKLKKALIKMLINKDGKYGPYKHPKYAERLLAFDLHVVPLKDSPNLTAAVSFEEMAIYIGQGFLSDEHYFYQLNVVIRHEMAHSLLRHNIRMAHELGDEAFRRLMLSNFHDILNWDMDFEISNKKYTADDKTMMRNLWLNGKFINCLVTEDHRRDWQNMTLEEMYTATIEELDKLNARLIRARKSPYEKASLEDRAKTDPFTQVQLSTLAHMDRESASFIWDPIDKFFKKSQFFHSLTAEYRKFIIKIYKAYKGVPEATINKDFELLTDSKATEHVTLIDGTDLLTPQEKLLAVNVFKYFLGNKAPTPPTITIHKLEHSAEYKAAWNETIEKVGSRDKCDDEALDKILKELEEINIGGTIL